MCASIHVSIIEFTSYDSVAFLHCFVSLSEPVWFAFKGGAPNYYPNSFGAPEQQPQHALEYSTPAAGDVRRYNSANDDNVSQVMTSLLRESLPHSASQSSSSPLRVSNKSYIELREYSSDHKSVPLLNGVEELCYSALSVQGRTHFSSPKFYGRGKVGAVGEEAVSWKSKKWAS